MRILAIAAMTLAASCQPVMASQIFPTNLHHQPEKFCFVAGVISASIMARLNVGYPVEYVYEEVNELDHKELSTYLNESVTLASQFAWAAKGPVPPKEFAQWNYQRCMRTIGAKT
jgi:hypothetical protein